MALAYEHRFDYQGWNMFLAKCIKENNLKLIEKILKEVEINIDIFRKEKNHQTTLLLVSMKDSLEKGKNLVIQKREKK